MRGSPQCTRLTVEVNNDIEQSKFLSSSSLSRMKSVDQIW